jgi:hypothetical protein
MCDDHFVDHSHEPEGWDGIAIVAKGVNEFRLGHIASVGRTNAPVWTIRQLRGLWHLSTP